MHAIAGPAWRARRGGRCLAFVAVLLLAGCDTPLSALWPGLAPATTGQSGAGLPRWLPEAPDGRSALLARVAVDPAVAAEAGAPVPQALLGLARLWNVEDGSEVPFGEAAGLPFMAGPSNAAVAAGWSNFAVAPGRHVLRLEAAWQPATAVPLDLSFLVPASPATLYIGSFPVACEAEATPASGAGGRACRLLPVLDQSAEAQALLPEARRAAFPFVTALAQPYPPRLAALRLPPPEAPLLRLDPARWSAAIDWERVLRDSVARPGAVAADGGDDGCQPSGAGMGAGHLVLGALVLAYIGVDYVVTGVRDVVRAAALRRQAEAMRAAWSPCEARVAQTLMPERIGQHLAQDSGAAPPAPARRPRSAPLPPAAWQAVVTRVVLRHCGPTPDGFGVEVATRWTAQPPGAEAPVFDASYSRAVQDATADPRLRHAARPPWEVPVLPDAPCRPLAAYCAPGGEALLLDDIREAVTGARQVIAATR